MHRLSPLLPLLLLVACGGSRPTPPTPEPELDPAAEQYAAGDDSLALPPAPPLDSLIPPEELAAEIRVAADSAADEEVLDALADAAPEDAHAAIAAETGAELADWGDQFRDGLLAGFERAYTGNRAPLIIGNHFESWNGGVYMRAVEETIKTVCGKPDVRCVSFRQLADWLDAQDPEVLDKLRTLGVGRSPKEGWDAFLASGPAPAPKSAQGARAGRSR
jgi:hypothetical protein